MKHYLIVSVDGTTPVDVVEALSAKLRERIPDVEPVIVGGVQSVHLVSVPDRPQPVTVNVTGGGDAHAMADAVKRALRDRRPGTEDPT